MQYYAVQIRTAKEDTYISHIQKKLLFRKDSQRFLFLKRRLIIRRAGQSAFDLQPLFPGYIFVETESLDPVLYNAVKQEPGFCRFLPSNTAAAPLAGKDLATLHHFLRFGETMESSKVFFDENDRIAVTEGPLKGLEGMIIKVDRRKKRAKVKLDFSNGIFMLDLAFEVIDKNTAAEPAKVLS